jgi:hypothetical protein
MVGVSSFGVFAPSLGRNFMLSHEFFNGSATACEAFRAHLFKHSGGSVGAARIFMDFQDPLQMLGAFLLLRSNSAL